MILRIRTYPDPVLRRRAVPVEGVDERIRRLLDDMLETMYAAPGIGLAAPQVGESLRVIVADVSEEKNAPLRMVNPEITWRSQTTAVAEEGCLSLPEIYGEVERPEAVEVRYLDETGAERTLRAEGLLARCLQHEIDHLDGVLFVDRLSPVRRSVLLRRYGKLRRQRTPAKV
ncbi:Peptide deformylase 1 [bacterium HR39]|nr:Peptide deformylase 1 [bacterium HR39]